MVHYMVKSSLTQLGVIPQESPTQPQAQSSTVDPESPQIEDISEGEISDSDQEGTDSGTPILNQLLISAEEEQLDYDSFPSPTVTKTPLWKFAEETPSGCQTRPKSQTATILASTPAKPSGSQTQAPARVQPQAPAQAHMQPPAPVQPPG